MLVQDIRPGAGMSTLVSSSNFATLDGKVYLLR